jgi:2-dehydropantoate 2-reductase
MLARRGEEVWFVARGAHLDAMQRNGLHINMSGECFVIPPGKMTDSVNRTGSADVVLFCVKSYDTESAAAQIASIVTDRTIVISLQNGVDNEQKIQSRLPQGTVYGGVAYVYCTITAPGTLTEPGGPRKIVFGPLASDQDREPGRQILDRMLRAGIAAELSDDISTVLWRKYIFISAVGGLTALTRLTLGDILAVEATATLLANAMRETEAVARARGVAIETDFLETLFETLRKYDNNTRSSLYHDLVHEKPMEIEALSGTVVRLGHDLGIPTPIHQTIYASLVPYHLKHMAEKNARDHAVTKPDYTTLHR